MTPREYLEQVVEPNITALDADYGSVRLALNVVHSVDALAAHIFYASGGLASGRDDTDYRRTLARGSDDYALLHDVAVAAKHVQATRNKAPIVSGSDKIERRSLGFGEARFGEGRWGGPPQIVVTTDAGSLRVIEGVARRALELLKAEMAKYRL